MRDVTEAHFLHQRQGLEAVLRPPVAHPSALVWRPGKEELIVASRDGVLRSVDPVLGTRVLREGLPEAALLVMHPDAKRILVVCRQGTLWYGTLGGETLLEGKHTLLSSMEAFFVGDTAIVLGNTVDQRVMLLVDERGVRGPTRLPPRVVAAPGTDGGVMLCRSTEEGLQTIKLQKGAVFPSGETTAHRLSIEADYVLGLTPTGAAIWSLTGGPPRSMRLPDLSAGALSRRAEYVGLGTRNGAVCLARVDRIDSRSRPHAIKAFEGAVTTIAFSERGRWLATGSDGLILWTWED